MGNKRRAQSVREETRIVETARRAGFQAERLAEGGIYDPGDVRIGYGQTNHPVLFWAQFRKPGEGTKRIVHRVVVLDEENYWGLLFAAGTHHTTWWAEIKATERLNAPAILRKQRDKMRTYLTNLEK